MHRCTAKPSVAAKLSGQSSKSGMQVSQHAMRWLSRTIQQVVREDADTFHVGPEDSPETNDALCCACGVGRTHCAGIRQRPSRERASYFE